MMIVYGIRIISLIRRHQEEHPEVSQHWYAYDTGSGCTLTHTLDHLDVIMVQGGTY